jgi:uncharacterized membrane protein YbhN (UPF0104 family)
MLKMESHDDIIPGSPCGPGQPPPSRRVFRSWRRWAAGVVCVILLTAAVHAEEPMITESVHSFAHLWWRPLALTVAAETGSMVAVGLMERRILIMGGLRLPVSRAVAIAHASNALSASLPVAGSGAAAAFS